MRLTYWAGTAEAGGHVIDNPTLADWFVVRAD